MIPAIRRAPVPRPFRRAAWMAVAAAAVLACGRAAKPEQPEQRAKPAQPAQPDPSAVVSALYQDHFAHEQNFAETYKRQRALFAPDLAALIDADDSASAANPDEIVGLDFDPLTDAQDTMTGFEVGAATRDGADAVVPVALRMDAERSEVRVRLAQIGGAWRITNLHYRESGDLVSLLRQLAADRRK